MRHCAVCLCVPHWISFQCERNALESGVRAVRIFGSFWSPIVETVWRSWNPKIERQSLGFLMRKSDERVFACVCECGEGGSGDCKCVGGNVCENDFHPKISNASDKEHYFIQIMAWCVSGIDEIRGEWSSTVIISTKNISFIRNGIENYSCLFGVWRLFLSVCWASTEKSRETNSVASMILLCFDILVVAVAVAAIVSFRM